MNNMIETQNLSKEFHGRLALKNVTMSVPENCVYGLLGANGAGKSTLLKTMTGLLRPSGGEIRFQGHKWSRRDLTQIGALIENPPIYENLTAWENMKVKALLAGASDERIREALEEAEMKADVTAIRLESTQLVLRYLDRFDVKMKLNADFSYDLRLMETVRLQIEEKYSVDAAGSIDLTQSGYDAVYAPAS